MFPVIVCIAKKEEDYIEEFIKYHLAVGFKKIYLYDNEDIPTYEKMLQKYKDYVVFFHLPFNNYEKAVQYVALDHFVNNYMNSSSTNITHVAHIDIDEFIVLKKHNNICDFINEYIVGDCQGIGMNWRFFGSSGKSEKTNEPVTCRFTMRQSGGNKHIKTLFKKDFFLSFNTCHTVILSKGDIKSTNNNIINGPFNETYDFSIIQLNHYKSKTYPEYIHTRSRNRADLIGGGVNEYPPDTFKFFDSNEVEDLTAKLFYEKYCT